MPIMSDEDWEEQKLYRTRNLIAAQQPSLDNESTRFALPAEIYAERPNSPLPDLIIEKEPNRHDDSEEYYLALENKMQQIFRYLFGFHNARTDNFKTTEASSAKELGEYDYNDTANFEIDNLQFIEIEPEIQSPYGGNAREENQEQYEGHKVLTPIRELRSSSESTHSICESREVTVEAVVHGYRRKNRANIVSLQDAVTDVENILPEVHQSEMSETEQPVMSYELQSAFSEEENNSNASSVNEHIEEMRNSKRGTSLWSQRFSCHGDQTSPDSIPFSPRELNLSVANSFENRSDNTPLKEIDYNTARVKANLMPRSSTPKKSKNRRETSEVALKRIRFEDKAVQTEDVQINYESEMAGEAREAGYCNRHEANEEYDRNEEPVNWNVLKNNFFVGVPKVYRLCSCRYHRGFNVV